MKAMLRTAGLPHVGVVDDSPSLPYRFAKVGYGRLELGYPFLASMRTDRMVFHATR